MDQAKTLRNLVRVNKAAENFENGGIGSRPRVLSFTSGKGGVGKSQIVANMALLFARQGYKILILDADMGLANVDIMFGVHPRFTISDVLKNERSLDDIITNVGQNIDIIPASSGMMELTSLSKIQKLNLLNQIDRLDQDYDFLLIDTASGISKDVMYFNVAAEEIIVVTTPEPTAITDAYALIKVLHAQFKEKNFDLLVNFAKNEREALNVYQKIVNVADQFIAANISYLGYLPVDKSVGEAIRGRRPVLEKNPDARISKCLECVSEAILEKSVSVTSKGTVQFFWKRLLEAKAAGYTQP